MVVVRAIQRLKRRLGVVGVVALVLFTALIALALFGPLFVSGDAPYNTAGTPYAVPGGGYPLGLDVLGRDVLARILAGGRATVVLSVLGVAITSVLGLPLGVLAGLSRRRIVEWLMRALDVLIAFPSLLLILVLGAALGTGPSTVVAGSVISATPLMTRLVRSATLDISAKDYIAAARVRGESWSAVLLREIVPNIRGPLAADLGLRFTNMVLTVASADFLGIGVQAPRPDWARMVLENAPGLTVQPNATLIPAALIGLLAVSCNLLVDAYLGGEASAFRAARRGRVGRVFGSLRSKEVVVGV